MLFRMITPRVSKSRSITIRKGIPKDVRAEYQRLYGQRWEAKLTLPAGTRPQDAKVRISEFSAEVESQIAAIRAAQRGEGRSLTQRQAFALAGEWHVWYVARHEENPGTAEHWRMMWDVLIDRLEDHAPDGVIEEGWRDLEWTREPEVRAGARPLIADEAKTAQFLASKGVVLSNEAQALFLDCVLDEFMAAILLLERCANRDYSVDTRLAEFPKFDGKKIEQSASGVSPWQLFDAWVKARQPAASGVNSGGACSSILNSASRVQSTSLRMTRASGRGSSVRPSGKRGRSMMCGLMRHAPSLHGRSASGWSIRSRA
jgi:hypothetical protein